MLYRMPSYSKVWAKAQTETANRAIGKRILFIIGLIKSCFAKNSDFKQVSKITAIPIIFLVYLES